MSKHHRTTVAPVSTRSFVIGLCTMAQVFLSSVAHAAPVTVNLGQSAEEFVEHGLGPDGSTGRGTYAFDQGACQYDGTKTTCTLSGAFTGTTAGFTTGTYTFITEYGGTGLSPIRGMSMANDPNFFAYTAASSSTAMTLNLFTSGGNFVEPLVAGGVTTPKFVELTFTYVSYACSGAAVVTCTPGNVGLTNGATGAGPTTVLVTFDPDATVTTTTTSPTTTTTTLPAGCGNVPLTPPSFASIDCRLTLLLAEINGASNLGTYQAKLAKSATKAKSSASSGGTLCGQPNVKKTKKRLQQAATAMTQFVHLLNSHTAKKKLDAALRQTFVSAGTQVQNDLKTFRGTVSCP